LDKGNHVIVLFLDFSKAFDLVDHDLLLDKLGARGITGTALSMIRGFLSNRKQRVTIGEESSEFMDILGGCPQGAVISPSLFSLFVDDLPPSVANSECFQFADDTNLLFFDKNLNTTIYKVQCGIPELMEWVDKNCQKLNFLKIHILLFSGPRSVQLLPADTFLMSGVPITQKEHTKFLGIMLDEKLKGDHHLKELRKRLTFACVALTRCKPILNKTHLILIYHAYFSSHLHYGIETYGLGYVSNLKHIFTLQKRAIRIIFSINHTGSATDVMRRHGILPFPLLINYRICCLLYRIKNKLVENLFNVKFPRQGGRLADGGGLVMGTSTSNTGYFTLAVRGVQIWNNLPSDLRIIKTYARFKTLTKTFLLGEPLPQGY
jgi:hypothetical protein